MFKKTGKTTTLGVMKPENKKKESETKSNNQKPPKPKPQNK